MYDSHDPSTMLTLRTNVSESEALREFQSSRLSSLAWRLVNGPLRRIAPAYVPFALYRLQYEIGRKHYARFFALDQVDGTLDLYEFPKTISGNDLLHIEIGNNIHPSLPADRAESLLREKTLRLIFQQGFFRLRQPQLEIDCHLKHFHIPYWLGIFGSDGNLRCRVLDAVRRRMEGQKAALLFETWFAS